MSFSTNLKYGWWKNKLKREIKRCICGKCRVCGQARRRQCPGHGFCHHQTWLDIITSTSVIDYSALHTHCLPFKESFMGWLTSYCSLLEQVHAENYTCTPHYSTHTYSCSCRYIQNTWAWMLVVFMCMQWSNYTQKQCITICKPRHLWAHKHS